MLSTMVNGLSAVADEALEVIQGVVPYAIPVLGAILIVGIGIRVFKKITGR